MVTCPSSDKLPSGDTKEKERLSLRTVSIEKGVSSGLSSHDKSGTTHAHRKVKKWGCFRRRSQSTRIRVGDSLRVLCLEST